jgi:RNA recognition motif-containing protein
MSDQHSQNDDDQNIRDYNTGGNSNTVATFNVFVGDLVPTVTDDDLRERFSGCGEIVNVNVIRERSTGLCKGTYSIIAHNYRKLLFVRSSH